MAALGILPDKLDAVRLSQLTNGRALVADSAVLAETSFIDGLKATLSFADAVEKESWRAALSVEDFVDDLMFIHVFRRAWKMLQHCFLH